jgi:hypothetical protein
MGPELSRRGLLERLGAALFAWWGRPPGTTPAAPVPAQPPGPPQAPVDLFGAGTMTTVV